MKQSKIKNLLLSDIHVEEYNPVYRKVMLLNTILIITSILFFTFSIYYMFFEMLYTISIIYLVALLAIIYAIIDLRKTKSLKIASIIVTYTIFIALFAMVFIREGSNFTLIWTVFMPITAIFINGSRRGVYISVFFYVIVFSLAYQGIGLWQDTNWNFSSFIRLVLASSFLTLMFYLFESSLESAFTILENVREKEQTYIKQLKEYSETDSLTSLKNRRHLDKLFYINFNKAKKNKYCFAFFILDVDFFKKYNDTYGHIKGDKALISVAKILKQNMRRDSDTAFRLGGEEFACLVMAKDEYQVFEHVEKIRQEIEDDGLVTASFGICIIDSFEYESFDEMYKIADKFLYEAKNSGRNKIVGELVKLKQD